jgi:hypothetical protein
MLPPSKMPLGQDEPALGRRYSPAHPPAFAELLRQNELLRLCLGALRNAAGELLSADDIAGRVITAKGFDGGDAILRAAIREQVGSTVKRLNRVGAVTNIGAGRASKWKLAGS